MTGDKSCSDDAQKPIVYLVGPYRAKTLLGVRYNVNVAQNYANAVFDAGAVPLVVHSMWHGLDGEHDDQVFLDGGLNLLHLADAIVVLPGHEGSVGSIAEVALAEKLGKPVLRAEQLTGWVMAWNEKRRLYLAGHPLDPRIRRDDDVVRTVRAEVPALKRAVDRLSQAVNP